MHDLLIRGAEVFDGLGNSPKQVDIAVDAGRVSVIGKTTSGARQTIDAGGLVRGGGSVQQGLSAARGALGFYRLGLAADKRYSLCGALNSNDLMRAKVI